MIISVAVWWVEWVARKIVTPLNDGTIYFLCVIWEHVPKTVTVHSTPKRKQTKRYLLSSCSEVTAPALLQSSRTGAGIHSLQLDKWLLTWGLDPMSQLRPRRSISLRLLASQITYSVLLFTLLLQTFPKIKYYVLSNCSKCYLFPHFSYTLATLQA